MVRRAHTVPGTSLLIALSVTAIMGCADKEATTPKTVASTEATAAADATAAAGPTGASTGSAAAATSGTAAGTAAAASVKASCAPWAPAPQSLKTRNSAGRADFFREYAYDFASGVVSVHDSDPFANGKEEKVPRVTRADKTLSPADKARIDKALVDICPDEAAMKAACAPGGCSRLTVKRTDGETKVEHVETVSAVVELFSPLFPQLRHK